MLLKIKNKRNQKKIKNNKEKKIKNLKNNESLCLKKLISVTFLNFFN